MIGRWSGVSRSPQLFFRLARTRYNQMMGTFRERSLDAPIAGTEGLTMLDKLASG